MQYVKTNQHLTRQLRLAIEQNDLDKAHQVLLNPGVNVNDINNNVCLLELAMLHQNFDMVKLLLCFWADPTSRHISVGFKLLCEAVKFQQHEVVDMLIQLGINVNANYLISDSVTLLMRAVRNCDDAMVQLLLRNYADITAVDDEGNNVLQWAIKYESPLIILRLLCEYGVDLNQKNKVNRTSLHSAMEIGNMEIVKLILSYDRVDISATTTSDKGDPGYNTLHLAVDMLSENTPLVELLINKGFPVNEDTTTTLITPLHLAVEKNKKSTVEYLIENGADINAKTSSGFTPLIVAVRNGRLNMALILMSHGARVNEIVTGEDGGTALHYAWDDRSRMFNMLINKEADVTIKNNKGLTPLQHHC